MTEQQASDTEWSIGALCFAVSTMVDAGLLDPFLIKMRADITHRMQHPDWLTAARTFGSFIPSDVRRQVPPCQCGRAYDDHPNADCQGWYA